MSVIPLIALGVTSSITLPGVGAAVAAGLFLGLCNLGTLMEMKSISAVRTLLIKPISALTSAILGILFLGDVLTIGLVIGGIIVACGVTVIFRGHQQEANNDAVPLVAEAP